MRPGTRKDYPLWWEMWEKEKIFLSGKTNICLDNFVPFRRKTEDIPPKPLKATPSVKKYKTKRQFEHRFSLQGHNSRLGFFEQHMAMLSLTKFHHACMPAEYCKAMFTDYIDYKWRRQCTDWKVWKMDQRRIRRIRCRHRSSITAWQQRRLPTCVGGSMHWVCPFFYGYWEQLQPSHQILLTEFSFQHQHPKIAPLISLCSLTHSADLVLFCWFHITIEPLSVSLHTQVDGLLGCEEEPAKSVQKRASVTKQVEQHWSGIKQQSSLVKSFALQPSAISPSPETKSCAPSATKQEHHPAKSQLTLSALSPSPQDKHTHHLAGRRDNASDLICALHKQGPSD